MAMQVRVHEARLRFHTSRIGYNEMRKVLRYAHRQAFTGALGGPYSRTNALAFSIKAIGPIITGTQVEGQLLSTLPYAASVERGAKVHRIFPQNAPPIFRFGSRVRPQLRFIWHGRVVYTPHVPMALSTIGVSHPGQRGKRFLRGALLQTSLRFGMQFIPGRGSI